MRSLRTRPPSTGFNESATVAMTPTLISAGRRREDPPVFGIQNTKHIEEQQYLRPWAASAYPSSGSAGHPPTAPFPPPRNPARHGRLSEDGPGFGGPRDSCMHPRAIDSTGRRCWPVGPSARVPRARLVRPGCLVYGIPNLATVPSHPGAASSRHAEAVESRQRQRFAGHHTAVDG